MVVLRKEKKIGLTLLPFEKKKKSNSFNGSFMLGDSLFVLALIDVFFIYNRALETINHLFLQQYLMD